MRKKDGSKLLLKPSNQKLIALVIGATAITGCNCFLWVSQFGQVGKTASSEPVETQPDCPKSDCIRTDWNQKQR